MSPIALLVRKEAGELLLSARGLAWLFTVSLALSAFGLLLISDTELSLLDNAQVVYDMVSIMAALGALLAIVVGVDAIAGERERGSLTLLLSAPISRTDLLLGKLGGPAVAWAVTIVIAIPYLWAVGSTGQNLGASIAALALFGTPVVLGFGFFALGLAARLASARASLLAGLITLLVSASPLLLGPSLRQSAVGRMFDAINPISGAVNAFDAVIIDSQTLFAQSGHIAQTILWLVLALGFALTGVRRIAR